ncbi:hypothetical protein EV183_002476, partial [Coemansia sp. RSA 2336]
MLFGFLKRSTAELPEVDEKIEAVCDLVPRLVAPADLPVEPTPGPTSDEQLVIDAIVEQRSQLLHNLPEEPNDESPRFDASKWLDEQRILLYVRANKGNKEKALERLRSTLEWHCTYRPHAITPSSMRTEGATGKQYVNGFDKCGRPLIYMYSHRENTRNHEDNLRWVVYTMEQAIRSMPPGVTKVTMIIDVSKYTMSQAVPLSTAREFLHVLESHYPERLHKALVLSPPSYFVMFFRIVSRFIDPVTKDKIAFVDVGGDRGKDGKSDGVWVDILDYVDAEMLQTDAGGSWNFTYKQEAFWPELERKSASIDNVQSDNESVGSDAIDSDVEERILSHLYYQSNEAATASAPSPSTTEKPIAQPLQPEKPATDAVDDEREDSKYSIKPKSRAAAPASLNIVKHTSDSESSDEGEPDTEDNGAGLAKNIGIATPVEPFSKMGLVSPVEANMKQQMVHIDALLSPTKPSADPTAGSLTHTISMKRARDDENEYDYLDEAEIQGRNRYFMEEKEITCHKCNRQGHKGKDCTVTICMTCGQEGHLAVNCKESGVVCHRCNMRGHLLKDCPSSRREVMRNGGTCSRCNSQRHHTDECPQIWRKYVYTAPPPLKYNEVVPWCYNCAQKGHFGDDCSMSRNRTSFFGNTAFNQSNCPGRCIGVTPRADRRHSHHFDRSSRRDREFSTPRSS